MNTSLTSGCCALKMDTENVLEEITQVKLKFVSSSMNLWKTMKVCKRTILIKAHPRMYYQSHFAIFRSCSEI